MTSRKRKRCTPTGSRCQSLLFAAILWLGAASASAQPPSTFFSQAPEIFTTNSHIVSTHVFSWFAANAGQLSGPWQPLEGRAAWTGTPAFWQDQVKQMMSANVDVMYVHLIPSFDQERTNLFQALNQLRAQGYDVPKVAPFLDPLIIWNNQPNVDLATTAGQDALVGQYTRFFNEYYSVHQDSAADSYLAQMNGRVQLDTWHVKINTDNVTSLSRADVQSRLSSAFAAAHPVFNNGIYMITTALNPPTLNFADEQIPQFEITAYNSTVTYSNYTATQLKAGYWDQNVRNPGSQLPRDGGTHYTAAWAQVLSNPAVHHVNIESWNEYDEGSGIYRANPGAPFLKPASGNTGTDTWSTTNDPLQYIKTTAANARTFNDSPDRNAQILWHNLPTQMKPGQVIDASILVRNMGDISWTAALQYQFGQQAFRPGEVLFGAGRFLLDDTKNEIPIYGGIFRGRPVTFQIELVAPTTPGMYRTHWSMLEENVSWFGQELDWTIQVVPEPSGLALRRWDWLGWRARHGLRLDLDECRGHQHHQSGQCQSDRHLERQLGFADGHDHQPARGRCAVGHSSGRHHGSLERDRYPDSVGHEHPGQLSSRVALHQVQQHRRWSGRRFGHGQLPGQRWHEQQAAATASRQRLEESGKLPRPIATEIVPAAEFYRAEAYHQQYLEKRGLASCHIR